MAAPRWTRQTALEYLASNPNFTPAKPLEQYSTSELKRKASIYQDAELAGRRAPTTAEARGHARLPIEHLAKEGHRLEQYRVTATPEQDIVKADLLLLFKRTKHKSEDVLVVITGVVEYKPIRGSVPGNQIQSLSFWTDRASLSNKEKDGMIDTMDDILDFANNMTFLQWEEVLSVSFAYPNEA